MKSGTAIRDLDRVVAPFRDPEIAAMAAIAEVLEDLEDPAARLRVMRWSFARFSDEFRRAPGDPAPAPVLVAAPAAFAPAVAPEPSIASDIESQIAELDDLFPAPSRTPPERR